MSKAEKVAQKPVLDGRCWQGRAFAYGLRYLTEFRSDERKPALYYNAVSCEADEFGTRTGTPIPAENMLKLFDEHLQEAHGLIIADFEWRQVSREQLAFPWAEWDQNDDMPNDFRFPEEPENENA